MWPVLSIQDWFDLKELCPFLELFKDLTLYFSKTTECHMSDVCLYFEDLLVEIKVQYIDKKEEISDRLWYAANAAYTKLTKYYTKISSENFAIATVLDPRYKLDVYLQTQDPIELRASAKLAIEISYEKYSLMHSRRETITVLPTEVNPPSKKLKFACDDDESELDNELVIADDQFFATFKKSFKTPMHSQKMP
jgi:hypothetical protein